MEARAEGRAGPGAALLLALAALFLWVFDPLVLVASSLAVLALLLPVGRRAMLGAALLLILLPLAVGVRDPLGVAAFAWGAFSAALLAGSSRRLPQLPFLARALPVVGAAFLGAAFWFAARGGWSGFDRVVQEQFGAAAQVWEEQIRASGASPEVTRELGASLQRTIALQRELFPALAGLQSLAALGLAWWLVARIPRATTDPRLQPLRPFQEFRFADEWVWVLIAGLLLVVLPLTPPVTRFGANALLFMGVLYAVRGVAVFAFLARGASPLLWTLLAAVSILVLAPFAVPAVTLVGIGDTWIDVRRRVRAASD